MHCFIFPTPSLLETIRTLHRAQNTLPPSPLPPFLPLLRNKASREKIRGLQSKVTAFQERIKLVTARATPDEIPLRADVPLETHFPHS